MVAHEIFGAIALFFTGVIFVSALSPNAATGTIIQSSFSGLQGLGSTISAPVANKAA